MVSKREFCIAIKQNIFENCMFRRTRPRLVRNRNQTIWKCGRKVCDVQVGYSFIPGFHALQPVPPCHGPEETDLVTLGRFGLELLHVLPSAVTK